MSYIVDKCQCSHWDVCIGLAISHLVQSYQLSGAQPPHRPLAQHRSQALKFKAIPSISQTV